MVDIRSLLISVALLMHSHFSIATPQTDAMTGSYQGALEKGQAMWTPEQLEELQAKSRKLIAPSGKEIQVQSPVSEQGNITYKILVTDKMGKVELHSLISDLQHRKDVEFLIKGFLPSEKTFSDISKRIFSLIRGLDEIPFVGIDPRVFREIGAQTAPVIAAYQNNELIAYASGIANPRWLADQIEAGKRGNLGNFGTTVTIIEISPEEVAAERIKHLDFAKIKKESVENYFKKIVFFGLDAIDETQVRRFKPIVRTEQPLLDQDGSTIIPAGFAMNLLDRVPLSKRIVVFDGTNKEHLKWVKSLPKSDRPTKYITTRFDNSKQAAGFKEIETAVGEPVYLLTKDLIEGFDLRVAPSVIVADNEAKELVITEYHVGVSGDE